MHALSSEQFWLTLTLIMTAMLWLPYVVNRLIEQTPEALMKTPKPDLSTKVPWADRLMRAHANAIENIAIFAPLVLIVQMNGLNSTTTAYTCAVYFFARLTHVIAYIAGIPMIRTNAFFIGFVCQMILGVIILMSM